MTRLVMYVAAQYALDQAAKAVEVALRVRDLAQDLASVLTEDGP